jgi:phospholipase D
VLRSAVGPLGMALLGTVLLGLALEFPAIWKREHIQTERLSTSVGAGVEPRSPSVTTCFTPGQSCGELVVGILDHAHSEIRLQAYGFTSLPILSALVSAKRRGVDVVVILDKSDDRASSDRGGSAAEFVSRAGIPVFIDYRPAIAHNKVIVVDKRTVVTGSYNFTAAAEHRNAENVTMIESSEVASRFLSNWESRRAVSRPYVDGDH